MKKSEFKNLMLKTHHNPSLKLSKDEVIDIIRANNKDKRYCNIDDGQYNLIVVMEELAELSQAISKVLRGEEDRDNLIEELADVSICIEVVKDICNISQDLLDRAISVKADRIRKKLGNNERYIENIEYIGFTKIDNEYVHVFNINGEQIHLKYLEIVKYTHMPSLIDTNIICIRTKTGELSIMDQSSVGLAENHPGFIGFLTKEKYLEIVQSMLSKKFK